MCETCLPQAISRRGFLSLGVAAALSTLVAACRPAGEPAPGRFGGRVTAPISFPPGLPAVAGPFSAREEESITLEAPLGNQIFARAPTLSFYTPDGNPVKGLPAGTGALVWLQAERASALQQLPPLAATDDIPANLSAQPAPTGETRPFGPLALITRAGWGAAPPQWLPGGESPYDAQSNPAGYRLYPEPLPPWLNTVVVHHAALEFTHGPRAIQRLHVLRNRFADVGYHFFVDGLGQLYEGRPLSVRGAHTGGYNTGTVGVCLLGNFELIPPLQAQLDTLETVARVLREGYEITHLAGHRDFQPEATVCPGENLWPALPAVAESAGLSYGTGGYRLPD